MKRIVAAPTAGASGVLPAVLLPLQARDGLDDRRMVEALYVAAGFGQVIATRASISGAEGGCQAEVGSASGMAAAALVHVMGGTPGQMAHACAMALSNTLGLVCDPVAGLVEVPCVNRNVMGMGAVNALSCAEMALSGGERHPLRRGRRRHAGRGRCFARLSPGDRQRRFGGDADGTEACGAAVEAHCVRPRAATRATRRVVGAGAHTRPRLRYTVRAIGPAGRCGQKGN